MVYPILVYGFWFSAIGIIGGLIGGWVEFHWKCIFAWICVYTALAVIYLIGSGVFPVLWDFLPFHNAVQGFGIIIGGMYGATAIVFTLAIIFLVLWPWAVHHSYKSGLG